MRVGEDAQGILRSIRTRVGGLCAVAGFPLGNHPFDFTTLLLLTFPTSGKRTVSSNICRASKLGAVDTRGNLSLSQVRAKREWWGQPTTPTKGTRGNRTEGRLSPSRCPSPSRRPRPPPPVLYFMRDALTESLISSHAPMPILRVWSASDSSSAAVQSSASTTDTRLATRGGWQR